MRGAQQAPDGRNGFGAIFGSALIGILALSLALAGCGGGGSGGGGGSQGVGVFSTSIVDFTSGQGVPLLPVPRNEALRVTFDQALDANIFGGTAGSPSVAVGGDAFPSGLFYFAFMDQVAARQNFMVFNDMTGQPALGLVGFAANALPGGAFSVDARTVIFDPVVPVGHPTVAFSPGFAPAVQHDIFIPGASQLTSGGSPVRSFGAQPPVVPQGSASSPMNPFVFVTSVGFAADTIPPTVVEISSETLNAMGVPPSQQGGMTIPATDTIRVVFSEPVDVGSIDRQKNLIIRNIDVTANGVIVPVTQTSDVTNRTFFFTPDPGFGAGPFDIVVTVGGSLPAADNILDLPAGVSGAQRPLANSLTRSFVTAFTAGLPAAASVGEVFEDNAQQDTVFNGRYNNAVWNGTSPGTGLPTGQLRALAISGSALPNMGGLGNPANGAPRTQFPITPMPALTPSTLGFFSPFDNNGTLNFGAQINPNGGSHTQVMYLTNGSELPNNLANSIELYEWGALNNTATATTYNGFQMLMGHTTAQTAGVANPVSLTTIYDQNFDFDNPQNSFLMPTIHPANPLNQPGLPSLNETPVTVFGPAPYVVGQFVITGTFIPFPPLNLAFDFDDNRTELNIAAQNVNPNLLVDINIPAPQPVIMPGNLIVGTNVTAPTPMRRIAGAPGATNAFTGDPVVYHGRFTIVSKNSSARTKYYDLGTVNSIVYTSLSIFPPITSQPQGTFTTILIQGADDANGTNATPLFTYVGRNGMVNSAVLANLAGKRQFRLRFDFESNISTNTSPFVDGFLLGYTFQ